MVQVVLLINTPPALPQAVSVVQLLKLVVLQVVGGGVIVQALLTKVPPTPVQAASVVQALRFVALQVPLPVVVKVAVQVFAASIVKAVGLTVPVQLPPQPVKVAPASGVAVKLTALPVAKFAVQFVLPVPQLTPPVSLVTLPPVGVLIVSE
jgi:hypothetical protein